MLIDLAFTCHCLGLGQVGSSRDGSGRVGSRVGRRVGSVLGQMIYYIELAKNGPKSLRYERYRTNTKGLNRCRVAQSGGGGGGDRVLTVGHKRGWVVSTTFSKTLITQVLTVVVLRVFSAKQLVLCTN